MQNSAEITLELWMWLAGSTISSFETSVFDVRDKLLLEDSEKQNMHFLSFYDWLIYDDKKNRKLKTTLTK